jgi:sulfoxide reductase catalytic subunit YedY
MDEAMHPLTLLGLGLYGEVLPNQNGAPIRLVIPWKYGFKSIKSIVRVSFIETSPLNTWKQQQSSSTASTRTSTRRSIIPRWSQGSERRLGEFFRRKTLMFNGYGDQVASPLQRNGPPEVLLIESDSKKTMGVQAHRLDCVPRSARVSRLRRLHG